MNPKSPHRCDSPVGLFNVANKAIPPEINSLKDMHATFTLVRNDTGTNFPVMKGYSSQSLAFVNHLIVLTRQYVALRVLAISCVFAGTGGLGHSYATKLRFSVKNKSCSCGS